MGFSEHWSKNTVQPQGQQEHPAKSQQQSSIHAWAMRQARRARQSRGSSSSSSSDSRGKFEDLVAEQLSAGTERGTSSPPTAYDSEATIVCFGCCRNCIRLKKGLRAAHSERDRLYPRKQTETPIPHRRQHARRGQQQYPAAFMQQIHIPRFRVP